jgi:hypothetical protein
VSGYYFLSAQIRTPGTASSKGYDGIKRQHKKYNRKETIFPQTAYTSFGVIQGSQEMLGIMSPELKLDLDVYACIQSAIKRRYSGR